MAKANNNYQKPAVTPVGTLQYPYLTKPDTEFDAKGEYKVKLVLPEDEAQAIISELEALIDKENKERAKAAGKKSMKLSANKPWKTDEDTGDIILSFKLKATGTNRATGEEFTQKPKVVDAKGTPFEGAIGNGSKGKVAFVPAVYFNPSAGLGVTLRLKAVKITELVEYKAPSQDVFGDDEGDYEGPTGSGASDGSDEGDF